MKKVIFQMEPLTCPSCIRKIETALNKTAGVGSAEVLFNSSKVKTEFNDSQVDAGQLKRIIENLGYSVISTKIS